MRNAEILQHWKNLKFDSLVFAVVITILGMVLPIAMLAQDKKERSQALTSW